MFVSMHTKSITTKQIHITNMNLIYNINTSFYKAATAVTPRPFSLMRMRQAALLFICQH